MVLIFLLERFQMAPKENLTFEHAGMFQQFISKHDWNLLNLCLQTSRQEKHKTDTFISEPQM